MNTTHDINLTNYNEAAALQTLLWNICETRDAQNERYNRCEIDNEQITITVGGRSTAFLLNDNVVAALYSFVRRIADENDYLFVPEALIVEDHK